MNLFTINS